MTNISTYESLRSKCSGIPVGNTHFVLKVSGSAATDFLNSILPSKIYYLQSYSSLNSLLLNEECRVVDVVQLIYVDEYYYWVGTRTQKEATLEFLGNQQGSNDVSVEDIDDSIFLYAVEGPYAWKKMGDSFGNEVLGLRIQGAMPLEVEGVTGICLRAGWSGEYAYRLIFPITSESALREKLNSKEVLMEASQADIVLASQETRTPLMNATVHEGDCPFEQDFRYMIDFSKDEYLFQAAIQKKSTETEAGIVAIVTNKTDVAIGDAVLFEGVLRGKVLTTGFSPKANATIGYVRFEAGYAHPGIGAFKFQDGSSLETFSSPLIQTLSTIVAIE